MLDYVLQYMVKTGIQITQRNYLELNYGYKRSVDNLEGEELAELPDGFEDWPEDEGLVN